MDVEIDQRRRDDVSAEIDARPRSVVRRADRSAFDGNVTNDEPPVVDDAGVRKREAHLPRNASGSRQPRGGSAASRSNSTSLPTGDALQVSSCGRGSRPTAETAQPTWIRRMLRGVTGAS